MRDIDEDAKRIHLAHSLAAERGEPRAGVLPVALGKLVAVHPRQPDRAHAQLVEDVQQVEIALNGFGPFDREYQRNLALTVRTLDVGSGLRRHGHVRRRLQIGDALPVRLQSDGQERPAARSRHENVRYLPRQTPSSARGKSHCPVSAFCHRRRGRGGALGCGL